MRKRVFLFAGSWIGVNPFTLREQGYDSHLVGKDTTDTRIILFCPL